MRRYGAFAAGIANFTLFFACRAAKFPPAVRRNFHLPCGERNFLFSNILGYYSTIKKFFQAEKDNLVSPKAQEKFAKRTENTKIIFMPQVDHDTFNSKEDYLQAYYFELFNFLEENL